MTTFDERETAFENMFAHDAEMLFRAQARRDKLIGLWAAEKMGMTGEEAQAYARSVVMEDLREAGDIVVFHKLVTDLEKHGVNINEKKLRRRMERLFLKAREQVLNENDH